MKAVPFAAREARRLQAWKLHQQGWSQRAIADLLAVNAGSVSRWLKRVRQAGSDRALNRRPAPGAAHRLAARPLAGVASLAEAWSRGARLPRRALDPRARGSAHPVPLWRGVHSAKRRPPARGDGLERAKAFAPRPPARRSKDHGLARGSLARPSSKAKRLGQSIFVVGRERLLSFSRRGTGSTRRAARCRSCASGARATTSR